ncbi:uncharacterized protein Z518_02376 [Rhinocladiella mackenziei CBS 650.93]|uniref:Uncharacterized protein n=1 Tax=Rhinocladiella mackenziei CBS 650.93 TaxID=1442369 RepID=A0A0D2FZJ3_9EURO|nr:uncharacterized protein Z518_02376 [Rhinocladiella mackenziei CBS 650.93]KIX07722.1 hypothetical protein Z518_02376 [Rhinocladiella mackenziei CBS 650.93]
MTAINHLLNWDTVDVREYQLYDDPIDTTFSQPWIFDTPQTNDSSDDLIIDQQSWNGVYDGLFISDAAWEDFSPEPTVGSSIETWATENLAFENDIPKRAVDAGISTPIESVSSGQSPQLCFGMIYRTAARLNGVMSQIESKLHSPIVSRNANSFVFSVGRSESLLALQFPDGTQFALLNVHISNVLQKILDLPSIEFEAFADILTVRDTIRRATKANEATVPVNITVYGSVDTKETVESLFTDNKVWLQHPENPRAGSKYQNPHLVTFPGLNTAGSNGLSDMLAEDNLESDKNEKFRQAVSDVYSSLKRNSRLKMVEGDSRLKTLLMDHQKKALDFMMQREKGPVESEFSLWVPDKSDPEIEAFQHVITKSKSLVKPDETGGGILADEMGMGKSLSLLALVTKTLENAYTWQSGDDKSPTTFEFSYLTTSRATLILVPSALLLNEWRSEIEKHVDGSLKVTTYHGKYRCRKIPEIADSDIVLTTYHTLATESAAGPVDRKSLLHQVAWYRIVLDEAHIIRRKETTFYQTVSDLEGRFRWCLTGTPIQNKLDDIGNLFAFIRAQPFEKVAEFRRWIALPWDQGQTHALASERLVRLIDSVCLRRSRGLLHLPSITEQLRPLSFSSEERNQYEQTKRRMSRALQQRAGEIDRKNTFGLFHAQLQLRILCNHGTFQDPYSWTRRNMQVEREDAYYLFGRTKQVKCSSCKQAMPALSTNQVYRTFTETCAHVLCDECLEEPSQDFGHNESTRKVSCPICSAQNGRITGRSNHSLEPKTGKNQDLVTHGYSTKINALMSDLQQGLDSTKSIIFSCWTTTLDLIEKHLKDNNIKFGRIDGDSAVSCRQDILHLFSVSDSVRVLIMTTGTGAVGLNLAAANRIFIVEPQWNPSIENQAIGRAERLGQRQHVQVIRYVIKDTVEMVRRISDH